MNSRLLGLPLSTPRGQLCVRLWEEPRNQASVYYKPAHVQNTATAHRNYR